MTWCMRTTLTLEPDVAARLERLRATEHNSFKELVNAALRRGLEALESDDRRPSKPYRTGGWDLGRPRVLSLDDVSEALAQAEGEDFR